MPYATDDYWYQEASLYRGDLKIYKQKFYPNPKYYPHNLDSTLVNLGGDDIQEWAHDKMMLDKIKRGEVESYEINLSQKETSEKEEKDAD